jgi:arylsulfatase A-like enzyme/Flp pilus assembly protein TadD
MRSFTYAAVLTLVLFPVLSCSRDQGPEKQSVLLVTVDTMRADRVGTYGCREVDTPHMDRLAREGVLFSRAYSAAPLTLPSHATIMTGLYPPGHGIRNNGNYRLPSGIVTMAEVLKGEGYATAAFVGAFVLDSQFALDQGFDLYHDSFLNIDAGSRALRYAERNAGEVTALAADWLAKTKGAFFLWVHYFDPHHPYDAPPPFSERYRSDPYLGEISYTDSCLGILLDALARTENGGHALVVLTSDHGESLGEHGESSHGVFLYEGPMKVPLIMKMEGKLPEGSRMEEPVSLADVFPTILDALAIPPPVPVQGRSLLPAILGRERRERQLYMETMLPYENFGWSAVQGLVRGDFKYVRVPRRELYNISTDPGESVNLAASESGLTTTLDSLLARSVEEHTRKEAQGAPHEMSEEARERLESLGYVWSTTAGTGERPDPKLMIRIVEETEAGKRLIERGGYEDAARIFRGILERDPGNVTAYNLLGMALSKSGDTEAAIAQWKKAIELSPRYLETYRNLGGVLRERGEYDASLSYLQQALGMNPEYTRAHIDMGLTYMSMGKPAQARRQLGRALELEPGFAEPYLFLGGLFMESGDTDSALHFYRGALACDTTSVEPRRMIAKLLLSRGEVGEAIGHLQRIARARDDAPSLVDLGIALDRAGRGEDAVLAYSEAVKRDSLSWEAYNNRGIALFRLGRDREAEENFIRAAGLKADYAEPYFNLGNLQRRAGRTEEAIQSYTRFLELWSGDEETRKKTREIVERLRTGE